MRKAYALYDFDKEEIVGGPFETLNQLLEHPRSNTIPIPVLLGTENHLRISLDKLHEWALLLRELSLPTDTQEEVFNHLLGFISWLDDSFQEYKEPILLELKEE